MPTSAPSINTEPIEIAFLRALEGVTPFLTCQEEKKPPASPPIAANRKGIHANPAVCLISNANCSFKNVGNQVTNIHHTGSIKKRELMMPQVFLKFSSSVHLYTWVVLRTSFFTALSSSMCSCSAFVIQGCLSGVALLMMSQGKIHISPSAA